MTLTLHACTHLHMHISQTRSNMCTTPQNMVTFFNLRVSNPCHSL